MDGDDLELFERSIRHATEQRTGAELDDALAELGWHEAMVEDRRAAIATLFDLQGRATATSGALDLVLVDALGTSVADALGSSVTGAAGSSVTGASGSSVTGATGATRAGGAAGATEAAGASEATETTDLGVVLPPMAGWAPPASRTAAGDLDVRGIATSGLGARSTALVVATAGSVGSIGSGATVAVVPVGALTLRPIEGVDPAAGLLEVTGSAIAAAGTADLAPDGWTAAVALGRLALAHELVGASRTMLALAREHALERVQFGRPISSFQAIRHRLAETLVAIETAEAAIDAAWLDGSPVAAAMAKALAGRGAKTVIRHCQQVLAGIGFTTEHALHLSIRRALVLDALLGTSVAITRAMGDDLIATRHLPPLLPL